jgi:hypothetical protein
MIIFWFLPFLFWISLIWLSGCVLVALIVAVAKRRHRSGAPTILLGSV